LAVKWQNCHKNTNIFDCKTFQNLPKFRFSVWKYIPSGNTGCILSQYFHSSDDSFH
jgi:hypothetical protein